MELLRLALLQSVPQASPLWGLGLRRLQLLELRPLTPSLLGQNPLLVGRLMRGLLPLGPLAFPPFWSDLLELEIWGFERLVPCPEPQPHGQRLPQS